MKILSYITWRITGSVIFIIFASLRLYAEGDDKLVYLWSLQDYLIAVVWFLNPQIFRINGSWDRLAEESALAAVGPIFLTKLLLYTIFFLMGLGLLFKYLNP
jgi:hypothetical protein